MKTRGLYHILILMCIASACIGSVSSEDISHSLIGYWTFDELDDPVVSDKSGSALDGKVVGSISLEEGIFGSAGKFGDRHKGVRIKSDKTFTSLPAITICAWVSPSELSGYREVFRKEDGNRRILFSFQHDGRILSLGLNVEGSGYDELDAPVNPAQLKDLQWHHVAGTFDGRKMRVYLDGIEIAAKNRPGRLVSGGGADAYIGSSGGTGEFFIGGIDDLQIYRIALRADQISKLHERGIARELAKLKLAGEQIEEIYREADTFAQTIALTRSKLQHKSPPKALLRLIQAKLNVKFADSCVKFSQITGSGASEYLQQTDDTWLLKKAEKVMGLATEYKPLTESQWAHLNETERKNWRQIAKLQEQFERLKESKGVRRDCQLIELMFEAGHRIVYRPVRYEAVAPYIKAYTPTTRDQSASQADATLMREWRFQADGSVTVGHIKDELRWTRQVAERIERRHDGECDFSRELAELKKLESQVGKVNGEQLYFAVRRIKRHIMFSDPVIDFDSVLFVDIPFPAGSEWPHETRHRLGYMAVPGGRLLTLKGLSPGGHLTKLMPQEPLHGTFWRPDLSFDARRVLFCFHPANEKSFHLYEINIDGSGLRQITDGIYDDVDPIYLPDGRHIIFASTRGHNYVRCMPPTNSFSLTRCDLNGGNIYIISRNNEPDYLPSLLDDGRVIYTRWEYTDKPLWRAQSLWTMNPDGTGASTYWGNQSVWPDLLKDARQIPQSTRVMFTGSAHHNWFSGSIGIVDPRKGLNFPDGLTKVTAQLAWPESGNGPVDTVESQDYHNSGRHRAYQNPYPLSEEVFLVSANRAGKFMLYLMDIWGNKELIYEGEHNIFHAIPIRPRFRPPVIADNVKWPTAHERANPADGVIFSNNIYHNAPQEIQGKAKHLRVLTMDAKTYSYWYKRPYASTGPVVSMVMSEGVKRILGTVPIEADGSVHFKAPSGKSLYFQLLDDKFRALQTMRSISGVMPGETRGCLGCHEMHSVTPAAEGRAIALDRGPSEIVQPPWGDESVSYTRFVQPVLDKYCGPCHQGEGKARKKLDLTLRGNGLFKEPYVTLIGNPSWGAAYNPPKNPPPGFGIADTLLVESYDQRDPAAYVTPAPMTKLSYKSRLVKIASSGDHHNVRVDEVSRRKLIAWVDTMCPYRGDEEVRRIDDPHFQGIDWLAIRPQIKNAPVVIRPGPLDDGF